jgi:hypothetical protein
MLVLLCGPFYRESKSSQGRRSRPKGLALTRLALPDFRAANRKTTRLKSTEKEMSWVGTRPVQALANIIAADPKMGRAPNKKGSTIFRYERIRHLVIPIFAFLNRHV